jgi:L-glyceraldehyde 3-phosphate reductase
MPREFSPQRYDTMLYRRCGKSGLKLPAISLGGWETYGGYRGEEVARECIFRAFDLGITHFDLANNYGTPPGNAEIVCGKVFKEMPREELIISSKAGYLMWPGPYGEWGSRKNIIASCDQSLKRLQVDYVDIFYHHRPDPETPVEESLGALDQIVHSGKALYAGVSNYNGAQFAEAVAAVEKNNFTRILIHQPSYNLNNRRIEWDLLPHTQRTGTGVIAFCPLAQGLLTDKYLSGQAPSDSRAVQRWAPGRLEQSLTPELLAKVRSLNEIAKARGQSLAQMALAWILRLPTVTSALIGASKVQQIEENVAALKNLSFTQDELDRIDALTNKK